MCLRPPKPMQCCLTAALSLGPAQAPFLPNGRPCLGVEVGLGDRPPGQLLVKGLTCVPACALVAGNVT